MTRRALLVIALLLGLTADSFAMRRVVDTSAPDRVGRTEIGMGVAAAFNDQTDDSYYVSGNIAYGVTPYVAVGVEAGWQESDGAGPEIIGYVPVLADIILRLPTVHEQMVPYAVLGLGGAGAYAETNGQDDRDDTGYAWKLGVGLDYFLNSQWLLNLEWAYWNIDVTLPRTSLSSGDSEFWTLGIGLKYLF